MCRDGALSVRGFMAGVLLAAFPLCALATPVTFDVDLSWAGSRLTGTITTDDSFAGGDLYNHIGGWSLTYANADYSGTSNSWESGSGLRIGEDRTIPLPILYSGPDDALYLDLRAIQVDGFYRNRSLDLTGSSGKNPFHLVASDVDLPGGGGIRMLVFDPSGSDVVYRDYTIFSADKMVQAIGRKAVPEPATSALMLLALGGVCFVARRKRVDA